MLKPNSKISARRNAHIKKQKKPTFFFGIATAAHHIEGNNKHNDWWLYERELTGGDASGEACDSYTLYKEDRKILQAMNCNSYRFSIEWSRIEPEDGKFNMREVRHYVAMIHDLKSHGIEPIVTLHHFTNPLWFEHSGGWERKDAARIFNRFVSFIVPYLKKDVIWYITINEPNVYILNKYIVGIWHPKKTNMLVGAAVTAHMIEAHKIAYRTIKKIDKHAQISLAVHQSDMRPRFNFYYPANVFLARIGRFVFNDYIYEKTSQYLDYIALNFYSTFWMTWKYHFPFSLEPTMDPHIINTGKLLMESEPEALYDAVTHVLQYGKPVMITENGKVTEDDTQRSEYLEAVFVQMKKMIRAGLPLIGYQHFTHLDSFEWSMGYRPKFGFYAHDRKTHRRTAKPSAGVYRDLISHFHIWFALIT